MAFAPVIHGNALIEIERFRYDELIAQEEELFRLKKALRKDVLLSSEITIIKDLFDITPEIKEETASTTETTESEE